jgi:site-specific recombinase XerD
MPKNINIADPIRGFFENHLVSQRGLSTNTVLAYRDSMKLFLQFASDHHRKSCMDLTVEDLTADTVRKFLKHLEHVRKNTVRTRNNRLASIHSFFRYFSTLDPRLLSHCQAVLSVPFKRQAQPVIDYLEHEEIFHILDKIDLQTHLGRRDDAILRILYNTGMRAQELVDLNVNHVRFSRPHYVRIYGKGHKERTCPLWPETMQALRSYLADRAVLFTDTLPLIVNAKGNRLTRFGLRYIITRRVTLAAKTCPTLLTRKVTPHTFRHTTAMHLLQSGVDLNMIRSWLGHSSIETTHGYVEYDMEMKQKILQSCEKLLPKTKKSATSWKRNPSILDWLSKL